MYLLGTEENHILPKWKQIGEPIKNAYDSQALLDQFAVLTE